jgi:diaminohydroxyphosphoribosylaminopyrimidine deaminase/5-amino-6-(5-phosphoribosylamino)uracil reductase
VFDPDLPGESVLATTEAVNAAQCQKLTDRGVHIWRLPYDKNGQVSLAALLYEIGRRDMLTLMVEGGPQLLGSLFVTGMLDRVWAFVAPMIIGGQSAPGPVGGPGIAELAKAMQLTNLQTGVLEGDLWIQADVINSDSHSGSS